MSAPNQVNKLRGDGQQPRVQDAVGQILNPLAAALSATPIMGASPPSWIRPDFAGDFSNTPGLQETAFHRDALGYTWLKIAATSAGGVAGSTALFTLPQGYRPSEQIGLVGVNTSTGALNGVLITPAGEVQTGTALAAGEGFAAYVSFLAER